MAPGMPREMHRSNALRSSGPAGAWFRYASRSARRVASAGVSGSFPSGGSMMSDARAMRTPRSTQKLL